MNRYIVVGGGLAGLLAASLLRNKEIPFSLLEKNSTLGGSFFLGHQRLYSAEGTQYLTEHLKPLCWSKIEEPFRERSKGGWRAPKYEYGSFEKHYSAAPFYTPDRAVSKVLDNYPIEDDSPFYLRRNVTKILPGKKLVCCQDGSEYEYEKLLWTASLAGLNKVWRGDCSAFAKLIKKTKQQFGGISWELKLKAPYFEQGNSVAFQFRYKDKRLLTLGNSGPDNSLYWLVRLSTDVLEDKEELAKYVCAMKREIGKEFPELIEQIVSEKLVYLPSLLMNSPAKVKELEILPDVIYLGPEIALEEGPEEWIYLDRTVENCRHFESLI